MSEYTLRNTAKHKMAAGELVLCMGLRQARTPDIALIAAACGFDAVYVDMEHSPISVDTTAMICTAALGAGITPIVRVPGHDVHLATRVLDGGALGVIFPHVNTKDEAAMMVEACRYPPVGHRSVMGSGPALGYRPMPLGKVNEHVNAETLLIVMLETPEGIANADAIAATPGIDMLLIGSNDLCTAMGIPGESKHPKLRAAYEATAKACRAHGKHLGIGGIRADVEHVAELVKLGGRFVIAASDVQYLMAAARNEVAALRKAAGG